MLQIILSVIRWAGLSGVSLVWVTLFWSLAVFSWLEKGWDQSGSSISSFQAMSLQLGRYIGWCVRDYPWAIIAALIILLVITTACLQNAISARHRTA